MNTSILPTFDARIQRPQRPAAILDMNWTEKVHEGTGLLFASDTRWIGQIMSADETGKCHLLRQ
jgi:hypothetical protein